MATASISEAKAKLSALLDRVKSGEEVTITDRGEPVARIVPVKGRDLESNERLARLERQGVVRAPRKRLDRDWLLSRPLPESTVSVLDALLEERRESP
ncbi:MAG: type II toxin-antitoxin system prevent-host-death family antitoxin [Actinobacteria bacterium]|nr:type II toxin-antitoxin system prevent-host-death family antitoxin [Actinomycetota bacterium]